MAWRKLPTWERAVHVTESTDSNADPAWQYPHRQTQKPCVLWHSQPGTRPPEMNPHRLGRVFFSPLKWEARSLVAQLTSWGMGENVESHWGPGQGRVLYTGGRRWGPWGAPLSPLLSVSLSLVQRAGGLSTLCLCPGGRLASISKKLQDSGGHAPHPRGREHVFLSLSGLCRRAVPREGVGNLDAGGDVLRMADIEPGPHLRKSRIPEVLGQLPRESPRPAQGTEGGEAQSGGGGERLLQAGVNNAMLWLLKEPAGGEGARAFSLISPLHLWGVCLVCPPAGEAEPPGHVWFGSGLSRLLWRQ